MQNNQLRSIPFVVPTESQKIYKFFDLAQARNKNYGLAGEPFRNFLLQYMMAKYGNRDIQNLTAKDGTKIFGPGLDGTEKSSTSTLADGFARQKNIKTGACLALGYNDGKEQWLCSFLLGDRLCYQPQGWFCQETGCRRWFDEGCSGR